MHTLHLQPFTQPIFLLMQLPLSLLPIKIHTMVYTIMLPLFFLLLPTLDVGVLGAKPEARSAAAPGISLPDKCNKYMAELSDCIAYSTGKADDPPIKCCTSVSEMASKDTVCLCYIVQQAHNGTSQAVIDMGLKIDRLVNLPTVCKLHNADPKECPKLLGISSNSPDYAIFNGSASGIAAIHNNVTTTSTAGTAAFGCRGTYMKVVAALTYAILMYLVDVNHVI